MNNNLFTRAFQLACALLLVSTFSVGQSADERAKVESKDVDIWSDGTRMAGTVWKPKGLSADEKLPALVLCHGWGGVRSHLNSTYAIKFASNGFVVLTFDYRGWGDSDSKMILQGEQPERGEDGTATAKVHLVREIVSPFDQLEDINNALDFIEGEPNVDTSRIGLWGTSFGGGLVVWTAAHDDRVKCVVSQVGAMDALGSATELVASEDAMKAIHEREIKRARGELGPSPEGEFTVEGLRGSPFVEEFAKFRPVEHLDKLDVPILLIDAENEELFDITEHSGKVYEEIKDRLQDKVKYHIEPGIMHYGIYRERYMQGAQMALDWFNEHLK